MDRLLDDFVESRGVKEENSTPIRGFDGLPAVVSRLITRATNNGDSWACWADERSHSLASCRENVAALTRAGSCWLLKVELYDTDGVLEESDSWFKDDEGGGLVTFD